MNLLIAESSQISEEALRKVRSTRISNGSDSRENQSLAVREANSLPYKKTRLLHPFLSCNLPKKTMKPSNSLVSKRKVHFVVCKFAYFEPPPNWDSLDFSQLYYSPEEYETISSNNNTTLRFME
eukprot:scaffold9857_cov127-Cylindrotheca_fusiformis.AAC.26